MIYKMGGETMPKNKILVKLVKYLKKEKIKKIVNIYKYQKYNGKIELSINPQYGFIEILPEEFNDYYEIIQHNLFNINFELERKKR